MTPIEKAAYDIGAKGSEPREDERLAFEAWMRGHCWKVEGDWDGKQYKHDCEDGEFIHDGAMGTRRLWAAWRDRGAVARVLAEQAQAVEPVAWIVLDEDKVPIMCAPARQMCNDHINDAINDFDIAEASKWVVREAFTHPAPPPAQQGLSLDLLERLSKTLTKMGYSTPEGGMEHFGAQIESQLYNLCRGVDSLLAQQVAVPPAIEEIKRYSPDMQYDWVRMEPDQHGDWVRYSDFLDAKAQQVAVPAGWALVPIEPTPEMIAAGRDAPVSSALEDIDADYCAVYKAMLAAAQGAKLVTKKDHKPDWSAA